MLKVVLLLRDEKLGEGVSAGGWISNVTCGVMIHSGTPSEVLGSEGELPLQIKTHPERKSPLTGRRYF